MSDVSSYNPPMSHPRRKLRNRFIASFTILTACLMAFITGYVGNKQKSLAIQQVQDRTLAIGENIAGISKKFLLAYDYVALTQVAENAASREDIRYVIIIDKEGKFASHSDHPEKQWEQISSEEDIQAHNAKEPSLHKTIYEEHRVINATVPVFEGNLKWGTIRVGVSLERIYGNIFKTRVTLLLIGAFALAGIIGISIILAKRITKPVEKLVDATISASMGKLDQQLEISTGDEIEHLAISFDNMMGEIASQRREIEEKLHHITNLQRYTDLVLKSMASGMITADMNGKITMVNRAGKEILEIEQTDDFMESGGGFNELKEIISKVLANGHAVLNKELAVKINSKNHVLEVSASLIHNEMGEAVGTIAVFQDISELKELQGKLQRADRLSAIGTVASGLAHDIKNPLSAIRTFIQLLPMKVKDEGFFSQFNITVPRELERIDSTIENLLELTRKPQMNFKEINVNNLLNQVIDVYSNEIDHNNIELSTQYSPYLPMIKGDEEYLIRAFSNLIINAIQAMENEGKLFCSTNIENNKIFVTIKDTGAGMDEQTLKNAFNPYFTTKRKGSGLGLSIVNKIVEEHYGNIDLESQKGTGTTFKVSLPISDL